MEVIIPNTEYPVIQVLTFSTTHVHDYSRISSVIYQAVD